MLGIYRRLEGRNARGAETASVVPGEGFGESGVQAMTENRSRLT